jgi:hypothetical protein
MDGKTLFGFGAALALGFGFYFWYTGSAASKPPVPEFSDYQRMNLSEDDKAKLLADIKAWFAKKGLDLYSKSDTSKIAAYLTPGQQQTVLVLLGSGLYSTLKSLVSGNAP